MISSCRGGRFDEALALFYSAPDIAGATSMIATLGDRKNAKDLMTAFHVLERLRAVNQLTPTLPPYRALLHATMKGHRPADALRVLDMLEISKMRLDDAVCFGMLCNAVAALSDAVTARKLVHKWLRDGEGLSSRDALWQQRASVNSLKLIHALTQGTSTSQREEDNQSDLDVAFELFDFLCVELDARKPESPPHPHLLATLVDGCIKNGQPERPLPLLTRPPILTLVKADSVLLRCFVRAVHAATNLQAARLLLNTLQSSGTETITPSHIDCVQLLSVLVTHQELDDAVARFNLLARDGHPVSEEALCVLLTACGDLLALTKGQNLHQLIVAHHPQLLRSAHVLAALVTMYGRCGQLKEAESVYDNRREDDAIDITLWTAMIHAYGINGAGHKALALFERMTQRTSPDSISIGCALNACSHSGLCENALQLLGSMKTRFGISPDVKHYNCVVDVLLRAIRLHEAELLIEKMETECDAACRPDLVTWMTLVSASRWLNDIPRARKGLAKAKTLLRTEKEASASKNMTTSLLALEATIYEEAGMYEP